ncbi:Cell-cycle control medial ring component [Madurella fahalii]|uniref:Cell-cycle control medial ring component n=1 Tax=Madurella fahalii TaxID=1157608 RepID=A0ABQ0G5M6_9PEZI
MATELAFAKSFLTLLDSKLPKITADHVEDPRNYPASTPYTLPRHASQKPFSKPSASSAGSAGGGRNAARNPGAERAVTVTVRSLRAAGGGGQPLELRFAAPGGLGASVLELKEHVARETGLPVDKVKLLFAKKPVGDSKILKEIVPPSTSSSSSGEETVEFSLMVLGGAVPTLRAKNKEEEEEKNEGSGVGAVAQGLSGKAVLETDEFWGDLGGFLQQRIRDERVAGEVTEVFKEAWKER